MRSRLRERVKEAVMACGGRLKVKTFFMEFERIRDSPTDKMKDADIKQYLQSVMSTSKGKRRLFMLAYLGLQVCHDEVLKFERGSDNLLTGEEPKQ